MQQSLSEGGGGFGFVVADNRRPGLQKGIRLVDILGAGDDPNQGRDFACGLNDAQANVGVRHRNNQIRRGFESGGMKNVRTRSIAEKCLLAPLLKLHDYVDIGLDDDRVDLELGEQSRDRLTDRPIADHDRTGVLHSFRCDFVRASSELLTAAGQPLREQGTPGKQRFECEHSTENYRIETDRDDGRCDKYAIAAARDETERMSRIAEDERELADLREPARNSQRGL